MLIALSPAFVLLIVAALAGLLWAALPLLRSAQRVVVRDEPAALHWRGATLPFARIRGCRAVVECDAELYGPEWTGHLVFETPDGKWLRLWNGTRGFWHAVAALERAGIVRPGSRDVLRAMFAKREEAAVDLLRR